MGSLWVESVQFVFQVGGEFTAFGFTDEILSGRNLQVFKLQMECYCLSAGNQVKHQTA